MKTKDDKNKTPAKKRLILSDVLARANKIYEKRKGYPIRLQSDQIHALAEALVEEINKL